MSHFTRTNATLAYIVAVLLLGGASALGQNGNFLLQVLGAGLIGWTIWASAADSHLKVGLGKFGLAMAVLALVQFVPLPPALWQHLPGRDVVHQGYAMLGVAAPWQTVSLAPWKSLASLVWWIPALAVFVAMRAEDAPPTRQVVWAIAGVAVVSIALGTMQRGAGRGYFYIITNFGEGPGFFANSNHQGSFILTTLALWGGWVVGELATLGKRGPWYAGTQALLAGVAFLLVCGVLVSGSLACLALLVPVVGALVLILRPDYRLSLPLVILAGVVIAAGFAAFLLLGPVANDLTAKGVTAGISRQEFLVTGLRLLGDFAPLGSGVGTFQDLYRWYEDAALVGTTYVNHAHDDLLEVLIETGVFGLAALVAFLLWFVPRAWALWAGDRRHAMALAASVVIGVELLHSLVDYPLRTAAMSSLVALACVLMVRPPELPRGRRRRAVEADAPREMIRI